MESRLPKPKFTLKKALSTFNVNSDISTNGSTNGKTESNKIIGKPSAAVDNDSVKQALTKAKSTHNVASQLSAELTAPQRPPLERSKTHAVITRTTARTAIKRPGTASETSENKRPNIKTAAKPAATTKVFRTATTTTANKSSNPITSKPIAKPKAKWDLKGRLEVASHELASTKEKQKSIAMKNSQLETQLASLAEKESECRKKFEEYRSKCSELTLEVTVLENKITNLQNTCDELSMQRKDLEENLIAAKNSLQTYQDRCAVQEVELQKQTSELEILKIENKSQRDTIEELNTLNADLQSMVHMMDKDRRQLHNAIQELKGNIRVFCRVRPRIEKELSKGLCSISFPDECTIEVGRSEGIEASTCGGKPRGTRQDFSFDKVFPPNTSQAVIFEELSLLVQSALEGYNVCVFAYGQTGSGKTYTMEGFPEDDSEGMIPRTVRHIFAEKQQFELLGWEYRIEASFLEIYNEHIVDLLDSHPKTHEIRMLDSKGSDIYVSNLHIEEIHSAKELQDCLTIAQKNRAVAATQSNERSSRSHSVARIRLIGTHKTRNEVCTGTLNLVDLAGSERLRNEEVARTTETKNINKSLANLGNVILALLKKQDHVPYRNSKLTHLLMPSLGGNSKTLMLLNISPLDECYNETLNSLRFASNVNNCKTGNIRRTRGILTVPS